ncbi:MAG TPA: gliding motility-associated C-terminal domain-containing protein, partial [Sphingobacteriaceae bacterium]
ITGGTKPYRFQWKGLSQTSSVINNLSPGLYELLVTDAEGCTVTASAEVMAGNCPPIAIDDRFTTDEEVAISGSVAINDFDRQNESLTFSMTSTVKNGRIVFTDDGKFTYTPNPGFWATETFTYQVCNTSGLCAEATAYISVIPYTVVSLTPGILNVREGKKTAITAKLMRPFKDDVIITISYSGNAIKEKDYVLLDQFLQIRIPKGQITTTEKITLAALTDDLQEGDENVILQISETSDPLVRIGTGSVVIISDIYPSDSLPATPVSKEIPVNPDITPDPLVSPNNDGQGNEFFKIENIVSFPDNEVIIFNRWGNEIFRVRGYNESDRVFSGMANTGLATNTNSPLPDGVYYYLITTKRMVNGQSIVALNKGYLILKR